MEGRRRQQRALSIVRVDQQATTPARELRAAAVRWSPNHSRRRLALRSRIHRRLRSVMKALQMTRHRGSHSASRGLDPDAGGLSWDMYPAVALCTAGSPRRCLQRLLQGPAEVADTATTSPSEPDHCYRP